MGDLQQGLKGTENACIMWTNIFYIINIKHICKGTEEKVRIKSWS